MAAPATQVCTEAQTQGKELTELGFKLSLRLEALRISTFLPLLTIISCESFTTFPQEVHNVGPAVFPPLPIAQWYIIPMSWMSRAITPQLLVDLVQPLSF